MGKKASGIAQIIIGAIIIIYSLNSSLIWSTTTKHADINSPEEVTTKFRGFDPGKLIMPAILGLTIIYFGIRTLKKEKNINIQAQQSLNNQNISN